MLQAVCELYKHWTGKNDSRDQPDRITVAETRNGVMVGAAQMFIVTDHIWGVKWGSIENVFVLTEYRRRGIAKKLMDILESEARNQGCKFVKLTTGQHRPEAMKLYQGLGYRQGVSFIKEL